MKKDTTRSIISVLLSFVLSLIIFVLVIVACTSATLFDQNFILKRLNESNYYRATVNSTIENFQALGIPGGIPEEVFDDIINEEFVKNDIVDMLWDSYNNVPYQANLEPLKTRLNNEFVNYANENNIEITDETEESLKTLVNYCADEYKNQISNPVISFLGQIKVTVYNILVAALIIMTVMISLILVFLFKMQHYKHRAIRYIVYSQFAALLMTAVIPAIVLINKIYTKIHISPEHLYNFCVSISQDYLITLLLSGAALGIIGVALLIVIPQVKKKYLKKSKNLR